MPRLANVLLAMGLAVMTAPLAVHAQVREVVSKEVSVGRAESGLRLELAGGDELEISFEDGSVQVGDETVGSFQPGGALDTAWRGLLAQAVALDDGPLAQALFDWTVPTDLAGEAAGVALAIDQALESALTATEVQANAGEPTVSLGNPASLVRLLLDSDGRLELLDEAFDGVDDDARVHVAEDVVIAADEVVASDLIVIEGNARIEGEVEGDVVVVGGTLDLLEGSSVGGDVRLADARLVRNLGTVGDQVIEIQNDVDVDIREDVRREVVDELREEIRDEMRGELDEDGFSLFAPFRSLISGVGGVLGHLVSVLILGLIGAAVIALGGDKVDVIAETARRAPGRSAAVGMAGVVLLIPVWVLGFVALVVSIVGIPIAIAWLPAFPLAACLAGLVGYLAVARNAGEWLSESDLPWTQWIRKSNSLITMVGGLVGLSAMFIAAHVVSILPFLGFLNALLVVAGVVLTIAAVQVGFGAVILTRGGRRRDYAKYSADEAWEAAMNVDVGDVEMAESSPVDRTEKNGDA